VRAQGALRLGFAGTPEFAVPALDALAASPHTVVAVFTRQDRAAGRGQKLRVSPVKQRALELGIEVHQPATFKDRAACSALAALELDALVVAAYGLILPRAALDAPRLGCLNIHASLLPRWRGAAPIQRAVLAGDRCTGITIMRMEETLDTGPMLAARAIDIAPEDTAGTLHDRLAALGALLIRDTLDALVSGSVRETPQPLTGVIYADKITKSEAAIDWREDAAVLARRVRAFNPTPVAETRWAGTQLRIWQAKATLPDPMPADAVPRVGGVAAAPGSALLPGDAVPPGSVIGASDGGIDVACGSGTLRITRLQLAGRKPLSAAEFLRAQTLAGTRFTGP
jgi:methionyl-tRNA formyltransferase